MKSCRLRFSLLTLLAMPAMFAMGWWVRVATTNAMYTWLPSRLQTIQAAYSFQNSAWCMVDENWLNACRLCHPKPKLRWIEDLPTMWR